MKFTKLPLIGAYTIDLEKREDERGFFARYWCQKEFIQNELDTNIVQINNSFSRYKGTLRGLHFQYPPKAEIKIVRCIHGSIWDVILDIRDGSPTYGEWYAVELNAENRTMMLVPQGFAHGVLSLLDNTEIIYLASEFYSSEFEGTLRWDDAFHGIEWPINPKVISAKDASAKDWDNQHAVKLNME